MDGGGHGRHTEQSDVLWIRDLKVLGELGDPNCLINKHLRDPLNPGAVRRVSWEAKTFPNVAWTPKS